MQVLQAALGSGHTTVEFALSSVSAATSHIVGCYRGPEAPLMCQSEAGKTVLVQGVSLDELIFEMGYPKPDFVKLDIEGAEYMALKHCRRMATEIRPTILVELHNPECDEAAADFMKTYSYTALDVNFKQRIHNAKFVHDYRVKSKQFTLLMMPLEKSKPFHVI